MRLERCPHNPIVIPGLYPWRQVAVFNPSVVRVDGVFHMLERACSSLDPLKCQVGLLQSADGLSFTHVCDQPVFTPEQMDTPRGTVEDPRVVWLDGRYYMTFVHRKYVATCRPNGVGVPRYAEAAGIPPGETNNYRSALAISQDLKTWKLLGFVTPPELDDRDNVFFPEKVNGRFVMLRRPSNYVGPRYGCAQPSIWIAFSEDLVKWTEPVLVATPRQAWEAKKIGAGAPPVRTAAGWLTIYHGVDEHSVYRVGAMLLDLNDPCRVLARAPHFIMEPEYYYEKVGLIIPRVIFPTANIIKEELLYVYYGCADTCISVATVPVQELLEYVLRYPEG